MLRSLLGLSKQYEKVSAEQDASGDLCNIATDRRKALVIIWSLTHMKESARLVRHLHQSSSWQPVVMIGVSAAATDEVKKEWNRNGIPWFIFGNLLPNLNGRKTDGATEPAEQLDREQQDRPPLLFREKIIRALKIAVLGVVGGVPMLLFCIGMFPIMILLRKRWPYLAISQVAPFKEKITGKVPKKLETFLAYFLYPGVWLAFRLRDYFHYAIGWSRKTLLLTLRFVLFPFRQIITKIKSLRYLLSTLKTQNVLSDYVFQELRPDVVVLAEDNVSYPSGIFIKNARKHNIPAVIIPYTLASVKEFVEGFRDERAHSARRLHNWLFAKRYPQWLYTESKHSFLRLPAQHALWLEWHNAAPERPWIPNDGHWSAFCAESPRMLQRYQEEFDLPADRLVLTGAMSDDRLYQGKQRRESLQSQVYQELQLPAGQSMILVAFPPDQFASPRPELEFANYKAMAHFLIESLQRLSEFNVVASLHPRTSAALKEYIVSLGVKVSTRDTLELVPACDVYVASVSATIRWAVACGIPVLNYDIFHYRYDDYDAAAGVITVQTKSEFKNVVERLYQNPAWLRQWTALQQTCAGEWGLVDGRSGQRMVELFERLVNQETPSAATATSSLPAAA